jgi:hypothetical protein
LREKPTSYEFNQPEGRALVPFFAVLNISVFTIIIFENQIDLITEIRKYRTKGIATGIYACVNDEIAKINNDPIKYGRTEFIIIEFGSFLKNIVEEYIVFKEDRTIL